MEESDSDTLVRIAVVEGPRGAGRAPEATRSLERLGGQVELDLVADPRACLALCERRDVDLVVVDRLPASACAELFATLRGSGPPVVVVCADEEAAVEAFRAGASECVRADAGDEDLLPAVALEQIRRHRDERKRGEAESRIRWLEGVHDAIVGAIPAALAVVDGRERLVTVNPEFAGAFGAPAGEVAGRRLDEVLPAELLETGEVRRLLAETAADRESAPRVARSGPEDAPDARSYDVRARRLDDEGRVLLLLADVTERQRLVRRIEELQRYNENIIQNMNSALLVVDREGRTTFANATAEAILGAEPGELAGRAVWPWFAASGRERGLLARTLEDGARFKGAETVITRRDGGVVPIGISCAPLLDARGARLGAVAIFQDLTEIKQLQRQVLQTEKMASIGQLAAGVAHEINNPMGFIHANLFQMAEYLADLRRVWEEVDGLRRAADRSQEPGVREAARQLDVAARELDVDYLLSDLGVAIRESQEGSERIRHIVQDLRDFSYQDTAERVPADVNQCVDSTASIVWTMMKHSVVLRKEYCDLPPVHCYPMQLKQVFMNLLVNAYQAIFERIGDSGETGEIRIRTSRQADGVVVSIADTGVGIPAADLDRIFDPFFTTKEVGTGTGLGLSTSFNIVQRHGGRIRVESEDGEGSLFEVWLPLGPPDPVAGEPA